jgi:hypothetical protein
MTRANWIFCVRGFLFEASILMLHGEPAWLLVEDAAICLEDAGTLPKEWCS